MNNIKEELFNLKDEEYCKFNKKLCPDTKLEMLGIRIPVLRKLAQKNLKEKGLEKSLEALGNTYFEEVILQGFIIAYSKIDFEKKLLLIEKFVPKIDSWAISDTFIPTLKIKKDYLEKTWNFILPYTKSKKEFDIRFAVIMMLDYFIIDEYVDKVIKELDKINHDGYYVNGGCMVFG